VQLCAHVCCSEREQRLNHVRSKTRELEMQQRDRLCVYGERTGAILQRIESERRFKRKPIGPIGLHVTLRDPTWATAVEQCTRSVLGSYMAWNKEDERLLDSLARSCGQPIQQILTSNFDDQPYQIPSEVRPDPSLLAMLDVCMPTLNSIVDAESSRVSE
jgi:structural maintenance of chromosomes protein 6